MTFRKLFHESRSWVTPIKLPEKKFFKKLYGILSVFVWWNHREKEVELLSGLLDISPDFIYFASSR